MLGAANMSSNETFLIPEDPGHPAPSEERDLKKAAALLLDVEAMKGKHLNGNLGDTRDISWLTLLRLYVAEGAGERFTASGLAAVFGNSQTIITRYVGLLSNIGLVEMKRDSARDNAEFLSLTERSREQLSNMLREFCAESKSSGIFG